MKRPRTRTDKYDLLYDLCYKFNCLSASERETNLENYLKAFSNLDCISELPDSELSLCEPETESDPE